VNPIDGRAIAASLRAETESAAAELRAGGTAPTLAIVVPTQDEATLWYVRSLTKTAQRVGVEVRVEELSEATGAAVCRRLTELSDDPAVHGVMCQTPLPEGTSLPEVGAYIAPDKDVDGANPTSLGKLVAGLPAFVPATATAVMEILRRSGVPLRGARAVVVGRSIVVGKPAALLLTAAHATVTVCHTRTADLAAECARADVLVVAAGRPKMVGADHVKPGAVVVDVGTNPTPDGGLVGDVDDGALAGIDGALTPVPGGVGPVTTAVLLRNTVHAALSPPGMLEG
jgi:methylenetetrahydrofolate dehydrogenase (NADP+)/methenyltetrahydrofolate cyclohydrolase